MAELYENRINANLLLKELEGGIRFGTDALLLADFASAAKRGTCIDLGTGSGVIPLLMLASGSKASFCGLELQPEYASLAAENARANGYGESFKIICGSAADYKSLSAECQAVFECELRAAELYALTLPCAPAGGEMRYTPVIKKD